MDDLVDFSDLALDKDSYSGSDEKYNDLWEGSWYLFKFGERLEPDPAKPMQASYESAPLSEHLCCEIFSSASIPTQETILGTYRGRSVVACRDFVRNDPGTSLVEFNQLERSTKGGSSINKRTPEYGFTLKILAEHPWLEPIREEASHRFWETLCMDGLIGNFDRHAGNWGYLQSTDTYDAISCAPVYDCGSGLYPRLSEDSMRAMLGDGDAMRDRVFTFPNVRLLVNGSRPHYQDFFVSPEGAPARRALLGLWKRIDMGRIHELVESCPVLDSVRREFYHELLDIRYEHILKPAYELALEDREPSPDARTLIGLTSEPEVNVELGRGIRSEISSER